MEFGCILKCILKFCKSFLIHDLSKIFLVSKKKSQWTVSPRYPRTAKSRDWPVRIGPTFSKFCWSWFGLFRDFEIFLGPGPSWSGISKIFSVLVWSGPRFSKFYWSDRFCSVDPWSHPFNLPSQWISKLIFISFWYAHDLNMFDQVSKDQCDRTSFCWTRFINWLIFYWTSGHVNFGISFLVWNWFLLEARFGTPQNLESDISEIERKIEHKIETSSFEPS